MLKSCFKPLLLIIGSMALFACQSTQPIVVLDSGHNPSGSPLGSGAVSIRGVDEVIYNDLFVAGLSQALQEAGFKVKLTRTPDKEATLTQRSDFANQFLGRQAIFVSIHHDSTDLVNLSPITISDKTAYQTTLPIQGYSVHISDENGDFDHSLQLAKTIAQSLHDMGRAINTDHANPNYSKPLSWADETLGIYYHNQLAVLRHSQIPAVLVEVGVLVDKDDEAYINHPQKQAKLIQAVAYGIQNYFEQLPAKTTPADKK